MRTQGHYLTAIKAFTAWLTAIRNVLARDPLAAVRKGGFSHDRKLVRRFLTREEWGWLRQTRYALLYETAIQTGYRRNELLSIRPGDLGKDCIVLDGSRTKNKKPAQQFITADLAERLRGELPFHVHDRNRMAQILRLDLAIARWFWLNSEPKDLPEHFLQHMDARGAVLDFHALRHTCGAWLSLDGAPPKAIQTIMRHGTITLTFDTYGHLMPNTVQDSVLSSFAAM